MSWTVLAPPGGRRVLIRWFDLDFGGDPPRKVLSAEEIARARRFHREADARRYLAGRAAMRRALGELLGSEPARLVFETGPHGKPGLAGAPCSFNFSRSGARAVLAVVEEGRVGVDLEAADAAPDSEDLAPLALAPAEARTLRSLPAGERQADFLRRWTAREALLKAAGTGLCCDPSSIGLLPEGAAFSAGGDPRVEGLLAWPLDAGAGFVAALATDRRAF
ncbi:MAG TPA: 4'-phosphopantetheinyl transferase superfamily protein [Thermoanaerobaculia bacterium]|nr:4'-phosphopantetheinyl transferase superfamily protein [Thermoanaerobaculia bacterium]